MRSRMTCGLMLVGLLLSTPIAGADLENPIVVSPGSPHQVSLIDSRCPTFIWGAAEAAKSYELAVYRVGGNRQQPEVVLRQTLPGSADAWTPALGGCLEPGVEYAWTIRAAAEEEVSDWSPPALFRVAGGPVWAPPPRPSEPLVPRALGGADFSIDSVGNVEATSFSGSGAGLADLTEPICDLHARTDLPFPVGLPCDCRELHDKCVLDEHCCDPTVCVGEECCVPLNASCSVTTDCCGSLSCVSGTCCAGLGETCSVPTDCCGVLSCSVGSCCKLPGATCSTNSECCNNFCQGGFCAVL